MARLNYNTQQAQNEANLLAMGRSGARVVTAADGVVNGSFCALIMVENTVLTSLTGTSMTGTWSGFTFPAGFEILGNITQFQLTSGRAIAYLGTIQP